MEQINLFHPSAPAGYLTYVHNNYYHYNGKWKETQWFYGEKYSSKNIVLWLYLVFGEFYDKINEYKEECFMGMIVVYNAKDDFEATMLMDVLKAEGIHSYAKDSGVGEYLKIAQGFSVYGKEIYVEEASADLAKSIIMKTLQVDETETEEEGVKIPWYRNKRILARIWLVVFVGIMVLMYILAEIL